MNRDMLCAILEDEFDLIEAENGQVGLDKLEQNYHDLSLILLDVYMPVCNGFEFLDLMRKDGRFDAVPVIVTTASGALEDEIKCLELGANDFVVKPYNVEIMMNRINNTLRLIESASIVKQLTWDATTALYNKEFFFRNVAELMAERSGEQFDMVCSDIEDFKALNDRHGEQACDQLLRSLAAEMIAILPGFELGGRIGGDNFAFLIQHQDKSWVEVLDGIANDMGFSNLNVKFGIVENVDRDLPVQLVCNRANVALDRIKGPLGVGVAWYDDELRQAQLNEQAVLENMKEALENAQFSVYYQPKHDLHTGKTGGAEALVRWVHPELGFISPGVFIPIFERNGFISKLDLFVWEEACREIKRLQNSGLPVVPISVNASRLDFDIPDLAQRLTDLTDRYGVDRSLLHIELTETAYADSPEQVSGTLSKMRANGFLVELDDFGAGYSSLASLNTLPLDVLKLDMSMIRQASALNDYRIVQSAIQLADILGLRIVVEGVETDEQVEELKRLGCDYIQGFYFSKPLERDEFEEYLAKTGSSLEARFDDGDSGGV